MCLFELWKGFVFKVDVHTRDTKQKLFATLKLMAFLVDDVVNAVEIEMYMRDLTSQFCNRFQDFKHFGSLFSFLRKPESSEDLNLPAFEWMNRKDFAMQLTDFKTSLLWTSKFVDLPKLLKVIENEKAF